MIYHDDIKLVHIGEKKESFIKHSDNITIILSQEKIKYSIMIKILHRILKRESVMAEWATDSKAMRARGIIVLVKSKKLVKNIETKRL